MMNYSMGTAPPLTVSQPVTLELIDASGASTPVKAEFYYDSADPYAVTTIFLTPHSQVRWTFGRELLSHGLFEPAGDGDVHVWPCLDTHGRAVVIIELCSPDGEALIQAKTDDLSRFVTQMHAVVAPGSESKFIDMALTIDALLDAPTD